MKHWLCKVLVPLCTLTPLLAQEPEIDLSDEQVDPQALQAGGKQASAAETLSRQWFENFELYGFVVGSYLDTGSTGYQPKGAFVLKDAKLYIEAQAWEDISIFTELQFTKTGMPDDGKIGTQETYLHLRDLLGPESPGLLNLKFGITDLPFGEEYLRQDSPDSPMINYPAAFPYGWDAGVLLYGKYQGWDWFASVTDGTFRRNAEDSNDKAFCAKLGRALGEHGYFSVSAMHTGSTSSTANCFSGRYLDPVGAGGAVSTAGASPNTQIEVLLYQADFVYEIPQGASLRVFAGQHRIDDDADAFDRDLSYFSIENGWQLGEKWRLTGRLSEYGTYDDDEGYSLQGRITSSGTADFGYDAKRLQRVALALQYKPNPRTFFKTEIGRDRYWVIDSSPLQPGSENGVYFGLELGVRF